MTGETRARLSLFARTVPNLGNGGDQFSHNLCENLRGFAESRVDMLGADWDFGQMEIPRTMRIELGWFDNVRNRDDDRIFGGATLKSSKVATWPQAFCEALLYLFPSLPLARRQWQGARATRNGGRCRIRWKG